MVHFFILIIIGRKWTGRTGALSTTFFAGEIFEVGFFEKSSACVKSSAVRFAVGETIKYYPIPLYGRRAARPPLSPPGVPAGSLCAFVPYSVPIGGGYGTGCGPVLPVVVHFLSLAPLLHGVRSVRWPVFECMANKSECPTRSRAGRPGCYPQRPGSRSTAQRKPGRPGAVRLNDQSRPTRGRTGSRREEYIKEQRRQLCRLCCWVSLRCPAGRITRGGVPSWWSHRRG